MKPAQVLEEFWCWTEDHLLCRPLAAARLWQVEDLLAAAESSWVSWSKTLQSSELSGVHASHLHRWCVWIKMAALGRPVWPSCLSPRCWISALFTEKTVQHPGIVLRQRRGGRTGEWMLVWHFCVVAQSEHKFSFNIDNFIFLRFSESRNNLMNYLWNKMTLQPPLVLFPGCLGSP